MIRSYNPRTGEVMGIVAGDGYTPVLCTLFGVPFYLYDFSISVIRGHRFDAVYYDEMGEL